jgi:ubiquinone biosynthesis protein
LRRELATLQDCVPPFPFREVRHTIESELRQPLEVIYERFQPSPVAAASVTQVHRAVLRGTEQWVAVKVRRPDILEKVRLDRSILLFLGRTLERLVPSLRLLALEGAVRSFCDAVEQQIHEHNRRFTQNFADETEVRFPRLFPAACSDAVLTMEFIEGAHESELEAAGILVHRVVAAGMRAVCRMIFLHGVVHADLHPGNLRFIPPGCIVLLDLGLVGTLDDVDRLTTARLLFAFAMGDGATVARLF